MNALAGDRNLIAEIGEALTAAARWAREHEEELRAFGMWGAVSTACAEAHLYAPLDPEAWRKIGEYRNEDPSPDYESLITSLYSPAGVGFGSLRRELSEAPLLSDRRREVREVLESLEDGRNFVVICGALPLVEYVLSKAAGKWKQPNRRQLDARLHAAGGLTADDETALLVDAAAVEMVVTEIPAIWADGALRVGALTSELNRHVVLHGTGLGWDDPANATKAVLLLAAAARVAAPLLRPAQSEAARPSPSTDSPMG